MNEIKFTNKIRLALNEVARVDARVAERLHAARERALSLKKPERAPAFAWAHSTAAGMVGGFGGFGGFSLRVMLPTVLLIAGLLSIYSWQQDQRAADALELDAQRPEERLAVGGAYTLTIRQGLLDGGIDRLVADTLRAFGVQPQRPRQPAAAVPPGQVFQAARWVSRGWRRR